MASNYSSSKDNVQLTYNPGPQSGQSSSIHYQTPAQVARPILPSEPPSKSLYFVLYFNIFI